MAWRYILMRLNGDGTMSPLHWDVPLSGASITTDLSGPGIITGTLAPEIPGLKDADGRPLIVPWSSAIFPEEDGELRGGFIVTDPTENSGSLQLQGVGFTGILAGLPVHGWSPVWIQEDPLNVARWIMAHAQSYDYLDLGMTVDDTTSPVRIGTPKRDVDFTTGSGESVSFQSGPYQLTEWANHNVGDDFDALAEGTPFDYKVRHFWIDDDTIGSHLVLGYPRLGRRLHDPRFVVGENITDIPAIDYATDDYANAVLVLGAGEGRAGIRAYGTRSDGRLRRVAVVEDNSITSVKAANNRVALELRKRAGVPDISGNIIVKDHPHAATGTYDIGDEILIETGDAGWSGHLAVWVRILSLTRTPEAGTTIISVMQVDKLGR